MKLKAATAILSFGVLMTLQAQVGGGGATGASGGTAGGDDTSAGGAGGGTGPAGQGNNTGGAAAGPGASTGTRGTSSAQSTSGTPGPATGAVEKRTAAAGDGIVLPDLGDAPADEQQSGSMANGTEATEPPLTDEVPVATAGSFGDGANHQQVAVAELGSEVRAAFERAAGPGSFGHEVTRMDYAGREVFRARVVGAGGDAERYIYIDANGVLVKEQQPVSLDNAPKMVRTAVEQAQQGARGSSIMRETTPDGSVSYTMRVSRDGGPDRWIQFDDAGNILKSIEQDR
jgi:hypothetical protein